MKKYYVIMLVLLSFSSHAQNTNNEVSSAINGISVEELYKSETYKTMVDQAYAQQKDFLPDISAIDAIAEIQTKIDEGYLAFSHKNGLSGYIDDIKKVEHDTQKVKEIHFFAIRNAMPPISRLIATPEQKAQRAAERRKRQEDILGLSSDEYDQYINHLKSQGNIKN